MRPLPRKKPSGERPAQKKPEKRETSGLEIVKPKDKPTTFVEREAVFLGSKLKRLPQASQREEGLSFNQVFFLAENKKVDCFPVAALARDGKAALKPWLKVGLSGQTYLVHPRFKRALVQLKMPENLLAYPHRKDPFGQHQHFLGFLDVQHLSKRYGAFELDGLQTGVAEMMRRKGWQTNEFWLFKPESEKVEASPDKRETREIVAPKAPEKKGTEISPYIKGLIKEKDPDQLKVVKTGLRALEQALMDIQMQSTRLSGRPLEQAKKRYRAKVGDTVYHMLRSINNEFAFNVKRSTFDPSRIERKHLTKIQIKFLKEKLYYFERGDYLERVW